MASGVFPAALFPPAVFPPAIFPGGVTVPPPPPPTGVVTRRASITTRPATRPSITLKGSGTNALTAQRLRCRTGEDLRVDVTTVPPEDVMGWDVVANFSVWPNGVPVFQLREANGGLAWTNTATGTGFLTVGHARTLVARSLYWEVRRDDADTDAVLARGTLRVRQGVPATGAAPAAASGYRAIGGAGVNPDEPTWGTAGSRFRRVAAAAFADGVSSPSGAGRPGARLVSNVVCDQGSEDIPDPRNLTAMAYAWGQFLTHELELLERATPAVAFDIPVPTGDPFFDPASTGTQVIPLGRAAQAAGSGTSSSNPRQHVNLITAWIDGSTVYGETQAKADALRTFSGGRLKTSGNGLLLPVNNAATFPGGVLAMDNDTHAVPDDTLFAAGDRRANENVELTSLHTLFVREHNRVVGLLAAANPSWTDEELYQAGRAWVAAEIAAVTYNEWLPALLGDAAVPPYAGHDPAVDPAVGLEFSAVALRVGHTLLGDDVEFLADDGSEVIPAIPLREAFTRPDLITTVGIEPVLKYLAEDPAQKADVKVVGELRNFLFGPPGSGGLDLIALDVQRARDVGLTHYNGLRQAFGMPQVAAFGEVTADAQTQTRLTTAYGTPADLDPIIGGMAEDHAAGGSVGVLFKAVLVEQFVRTRAADPLWYERAYAGVALDALRATTLSQIIRDNTPLTNLRPNVFFVGPPPLAADPAGAAELAAQPVGCYTGEDLEVDFAADPPADATGWQVAVTVARTPGGPALFELTDGAGLTWDDRAAGSGHFILTHVETAAAGRLYYELRRLNAGRNAVLAQGPLRIRQSVGD